MELTFSNVLAHINTVYVLITKQSKEKNKDGGQTDVTVWTNEEERVGLQGPKLRLKVIPSGPFVWNYCHNGRFELLVFMQIPFDVALPFNQGCFSSIFFCLKYCPLEAGRAIICTFWIHCQSKLAYQ